VACPTCGRTAEAWRSLDGGLNVKHGEHVFVCPRPLDRNPLAALLSYLGAVAFLALIFGAVARMVDPWMCPIVLFCTLFGVGMIVILQLATIGKLDVNLVKLVEIFYRTLPVLLGRDARKGTVTPKSGS